MQTRCSLVACLRGWVKRAESFVLPSISCNCGEDPLLLMTYTRLRQFPARILEVHACETLAQHRVALFVELLRRSTRFSGEQELPSIGLLAERLLPGSGWPKSGCSSTRVMVQIRLEQRRVRVHRATVVVGATQASAVQLHCPRCSQLPLIPVAGLLCHLCFKTYKY